MKRIHFTQALIITGMLLAARAMAKPLDLQMGSRGFGMGGAFAAISDDATATFWNPAGLSQLNSLTLSETNWILQDVPGVNVNYFTGAIPISQVGTVSGGWLMQYANLEQGEPGTALHHESNWYEHAFSLAAGRELWKKLWIFENTSLGFSLDRYVLNSGEMNGAGTGFDMGFLTRFPHGVRLGIVAKSLGADMMGDKIDPEFRAGLGYIWQGREHHKVTLDVDFASKENVEYQDGVNGVATNYKGFVGAEYVFMKEGWSGAVRAGANSGFLNSRDEMSYSGGLGVNFRGVSVQYAYQYNANQDLSLGQSHRFTLEVSLGDLMNKEEGRVISSQESSSLKAGDLSLNDPATDFASATKSDSNNDSNNDSTSDSNNDEKSKLEAIKAKYRK